MRSLHMRMHLDWFLHLLIFHKFAPTFAPRSIHSFPHPFIHYHILAFTFRPLHPRQPHACAYMAFLRGLLFWFLWWLQNMTHGFGVCFQRNHCATEYYTTTHDIFLRGLIFGCYDGSKIWRMAFLFVSKEITVLPNTTLIGLKTKKLLSWDVR